MLMNPAYLGFLDKVQTSYPSCELSSYQYQGEWLPNSLTAVTHEHISKASFQDTVCRRWDVWLWVTVVRELGIHSCNIRNISFEITTVTLVHSSFEYARA